MLYWGSGRFTGGVILKWLGLGAYDPLGEAFRLGPGFLQEASQRCYRRGSRYEIGCSLEGLGLGFKVYLLVASKEWIDGSRK